MLNIDIQQLVNYCGTCGCLLVKIQVNTTQQNQAEILSTWIWQLSHQFFLSFYITKCLEVFVINKSVREIVTCRQFHQHFTYDFFVRIFWQSQNVTRKLKFIQKIRSFNVDEIITWRKKLSRQKVWKTLNAQLDAKYQKTSCDHRTPFQGFSVIFWPSWNLSNINLYFKRDYCN